MILSQEEIDELIRELQDYDMELRNYVAEHSSPDMTDTEIDFLVNEFKRNSAEIRRFIVTVLEDEETENECKSY